MSASRNAGGFRLDDTRALHDLVHATLYEISRTCGHEDEATMLRRVRVFAHWCVAAAEAAFESDAETEAIAAMDTALADFIRRRAAGERGEDDA